MRVMAIDYGDQRIGIAVSDLLCMLCGEAFTMQEWDMARAAKRIAEEVAKREVGTLVLGLPKNMDSTVGERAEKCRMFADELSKATGIEAVIRDERLSTVSAHNALNATNTRGKKRKAVVDQVAAVMILQDYIDFRKNQR